jgi:hypothetical protein
MNAGVVRQLNGDERQRSSAAEYGEGDGDDNGVLPRISRMAAEYGDGDDNGEDAMEPRMNLRAQWRPEDERGLR